MGLQFNLMNDYFFVIHKNEEAEQVGYNTMWKEVSWVSSENEHETN